MTALEKLSTSLVLTDGSYWHIIAHDASSSNIVRKLTDIFNLTRTKFETVSCAPYIDDFISSKLLNSRIQRRLLVTCQQERKSQCPSILPAYLLKNKKISKTDTNIRRDKSLTIGPPRVETITCNLSIPRNNDLIPQIIQIANVIALFAENEGGFLLHGALIESDGKGIILAGTGGVGKSTACKRLPQNWRPLCDDVTLVVTDAKGSFWAHPWPTWSKLLFGESKDTINKWNFEEAVPLTGVFFIQQAIDLKIERIGSISQRICMLFESSEQASIGITRAIDKSDVRINRLNRFHNICSLASAVPCFVFYLNQRDAFWVEIEKYMFR